MNVVISHSPKHLHTTTQFYTNTGINIVTILFNVWCSDSCGSIREDCVLLWMARAERWPSVFNNRGEMEW